MVRPVAKAIQPTALGKALAEQLALYREDKVEQINEAGERAAKALVKKTKATAPKRSGDFQKAITYKAVKSSSGIMSYIWGVKAPHHRLTHLLVHGHPTVNGGRVPGDPFLEKALDTVLPEYEREVEEALKE